MFAKTFNRIFEPEDLKNSYKINYLVGSGITFLGFSQAWFWNDPVLGASLVAVGQLMTGLAFDFRNERIENGFDDLKERVEELED